MTPQSLCADFGRNKIPEMATLIAAIAAHTSAKSSLNDLPNGDWGRGHPCFPLHSGFTLVYWLRGSCRWPPNGFSGLFVARARINIRTRCHCRPVTVEPEPAPEHSPLTLISVALILPSQSFPKMRCAALATLFFVLFSLFSCMFPSQTANRRLFSDFVCSHGVCCADCCSYRRGLH